MTNHNDDRDATVDRLLARMAVAPDIGPDEGPNDRPDNRPDDRPDDRTAACLDAATLAAWADGTLNAGELAAAEAHAADCTNCQAVLAVMSKTAPPVQPAAGWTWRLPSIRWLVPLTAAAAAATIWMVVPLRQRPAEVREVSQSAESLPPAPTAERSAKNSTERAPEAPGQQAEVDAGQKGVASPDAAVARSAPPANTATADARRENAQAADAATPAPSAPQASPAARTMAFGATEQVVVSSNPGSRWRILAGGAVQRSEDGGATWQAQSTGVSETLSAGSSPLPSVCWLVGPKGIVLLSSDGRTWARVPFPEAATLVAVRATDVQTATVTTADGREFATEDGGQTWARAPAR